MPLAIVVPMFNEAQGVTEGLHRIAETIETLPVSTVLIAVDDGSTDMTSEILAELQTVLHELVVLRHEANKGFGAALVTGAKEARRLGAMYVLFMDSDQTNPPEHISRFLEPMARGIDMIKASRYHKEGAMIGVPWPRDLLSRLAGVTARNLYRIGVRDCTNGFHAIKTELFLSMNLKESGFSILMEELLHAKRLGCSFEEVPTVLRAREVGQSPSKFRFRFRLIWEYLRYAIRAAFV